MLSLKKFYPKTRVYIIVCEHNSFKKKIEQDFNVSELNNLIWIYYSGNGLQNMNLKKTFLLFFAFFSKSIVVSEYFNFIPRLISILTLSKSISVIYGVLTSNNFKNTKKNHSFLSSRLTHKLYADHFLIINRKQTHQLIKSNFKSKRVDFIEIKRTLKTVKNKSQYCLWISQCWGEDGHKQIEKLQQKCIARLNLFFEVVVVCHPRDSKTKYETLQNKKLYSLNNAIEFCKNNAPPNYVFGIASSALLEFKDYGQKVLRFRNKEVDSFVSNNFEIDEIKSIDLEAVKSNFINV